MKRLEQDRAAATPLIPRLLAGLAVTACRYPRLVLTCALVLVILSVHAACTRLEYRTSRNDLLNPHQECQRRWQRYLDEFGSDDDVVVVVEGSDRTRMEQALEAVAAVVRGRGELFDRLFYKVDLRPLADRALLYLTPDEIHTIRDRLQEMGPLLTFGPVGWRTLTLANLVAEARQRVERTSLHDEAFWQQFLAVCHSAAATLAEPTRYGNPWSSIVPERPGQTNLLATPQYFFSDDGALAFLLVRPSLEAGSFTAARKSVETLRTDLDEVCQRFPELQFGLTGMPVLETDEMTATQEDTTRAGWLALAGVTLLYLVVYRGLRYPVLTVATLLAGTAWALGWLTWTVGHLNILSATFGIMLLGMGDYGVLWVTRHEQERAAGSDTEVATRATALGIGPGILTAAVTTALAFYAAMLADFQAVVELGWIAGSGVLLCALACFTVLPALLTFADRAPRLAAGGLHLDKQSAPRERAWLPFLASRPRWVVGSMLTLTALVGLGTCAVHYDHNLLRLQAHGLESVRWELRLIERTAGASWHAVSYRASRDEVLALKARYEQLPGVSRVVEVASLVPADQDTKLELLREIQQRLRSLPERGASFTPLPANSEAVCADLHDLHNRLQAGHASVGVTLCPILEDLSRQLERLPAATAARRLHEFDRRLASDLAENLHRLRDVSTPRPLRLEDLPAPLRERYLSAGGQWLLRVFAKECLWDFAPLGEFVRQVQTVDPEATGRPFTTYEGLGAMKSGFQWAALYALGAIILVLLLDFRGLWHVLLALTPLALGVLLSLGVMGWWGITLNPANTIAFPLILGVGVDNGVHVLHDYLARRTGRPYTLGRATGRGILVAALTTVVGFGTLMIARHQGQAGLGFTLGLGVTCCMVASLVFLPALLRLLSANPKAETIPLPQAVPLRRAA